MVVVFVVIARARTSALLAEAKFRENKRTPIMVIILMDAA
jgi:hypothetical protein